MVPLSQFLLTQALWSITAGLNQLLLLMLILGILLKVWCHCSMLRSLLVSIALSLVAFGIFFGSVALIFMWLLDIHYVPPSTAYEDSFAVLSSAGWQAGIYSVLQLLLMSILHKIMTFSVARMATCILIANILSAFIVYKIVPPI